jgi:hypothetical protein
VDQQTLEELRKVSRILFFLMFSYTFLASVHLKIACIPSPSTAFSHYFWGGISL